MSTAASTPDGAGRQPEMWTYELFGCFDDFSLCVFTFLAPCYTAGRNAEAIGEDGCVVGNGKISLAYYCNVLSRCTNYTSVYEIYLHSERVKMRELLILNPFLLYWPKLKNNSEHLLYGDK